MDEGKFPGLKRKAKRGQIRITEFLEKQGYKVLQLDYESPYNESTDVENWRELPKVPDGLAKKDGEAFFFEVKTKSTLNLIVNVRNYREYIQIQLNFFPVVIYFFIEPTGAIYKHKVESRDYPTRKEWNGNIVYILDDYVEQLA